MLPPRLMASLTTIEITDDKLITAYQEVFAITTHLLNKIDDAPDIKFSLQRVYKTFKEECVRLNDTELEERVVAWIKQYYPEASLYVLEQTEVIITSLIFWLFVPEADKELLLAPVGYSTTLLPYNEHHGISIRPFGYYTNATQVVFNTQCSYIFFSDGKMKVMVSVHCVPIPPDAKVLVYATSLLPDDPINITRQQEWYAGGDIACSAILRDTSKLILEQEVIGGVNRYVTGWLPDFEAPIHLNVPVDDYDVYTIAVSTYSKYYRRLFVIFIEKPKELPPPAPRLKSV